MVEQYRSRLSTSGRIIRINSNLIFKCLKTYAPSEVTFREEMDGQETAWCPYCDTDAVLGDAAGYPITLEFLKEMKKEWF